MKYLKAMIWPALAVLCGCRDAAAPHVVDVISYDANQITECVVRRDGSVWCWGSNYNGASGQPLNVESVEEPTQVAGIEGATQLSMGMFGGCAIASDAVWCWGHGAAPAKVEGLPEGITSVVAGERHDTRCALSGDGGIWCWGWLVYPNVSGAMISVSAVHTVMLPKIVSLERGGAIIALDEQGERFVGRYDMEPLRGLARERVARRVVSVSHGMVFEDERGRVWALSGMDVVSKEPSKLNFRMVGLTPYELPELAGVSGWSSDESSACGVRDEQVRCVASLLSLDRVEEMPAHLEWRGIKQVVVASQLIYGLDARGAVRWSKVIHSPHEKSFPDVSALNARMSALGEGWERMERIGADVICVMGAQGRRCWGDNGVALDAQLQALAPASSGFAASSDELCVLGTEGVVRCVGRSAGSRAATRLEGATKLAGSYRQMCALKEGAVWCWDGEHPASRGTKMPDVVITRLDAVGPDVVARDAAGAAYAVGALEFLSGIRGIFEGDDVGSLRSDPNSAKMLGMAMTFQHNAQMEGGCALEAESGLVRCVANGEERGLVRIEAGARQIAVEDSTHGCALMAADGTVRCWEDSEVKTVEGLSGLTQLDFKSGWGCGVGEGGVVWCWGKNWRGQLGVKGEVFGPVQVPGVSGAARVELWDEASCAILADGSRKCWGNVPKNL